MERLQQNSRLQIGIVVEHRALSELESCALAVIWRDGPLTAYDLRGVFQNSITASWRASTGSIYPLVRRLESYGCIKTVEVTGNSRGARQLKITRSGKTKLKHWLESPANDLAGPVTDPIRTRLYFLNSLDQPQQKRLLGQWIRETDAAIAVAKASLKECQSTGKRLSAAAEQGAVMQLQARKKWLKHVENNLEQVSGDE